MATKPAGSEASDMSEAYSNNKYPIWKNKKIIGLRNPYRRNALGV